MARRRSLFRAPRGYGWITNPKKAAYNRSYYRRRKAEDALIGLLITACVMAVVGLAIAVYHLAVLLLKGFVGLCRFLYRKYRERKLKQSAGVVVALNDSTKKHFRIRYRDFTGQETTREIDVLTSSSADLFLAFCLLRNEVRTFRFDRIQECVDRESGEVVADLRLYLASQSDVDGSARQPG